MRDENLRQLELARLELRLDVLDEMQIGLFRLGIVRVAGHGDVTLGMVLVERGAEFAPIEQPAFQFGGRFAGGGARFQLVEQRRDLVPIAQSSFAGTNVRGLTAGKFSNGNKFMAER